MKQDPTNLLKEALKLPPEGRAALAAALLDSLDHEVDQDLDSGAVRPIPWSKARLKIFGR
jgi:hypothetical protein